MFDSIWFFARRQLAPRWKRVLGTSHPFAALILGLGGANFPAFQENSARVSEFAGALLTYNTVVIGFCVTAMAICFTFSKRFSTILSKISDNDTGFSAFEDLIFVFSWTSIVHISSLVLILSIYLSGGSVEIKYYFNGNFTWLKFIGISVQSYAIAQFLVTAIVVHQAAILHSKVSSQD